MEKCRVTAIFSSPREAGNSTTLAKEICRGVREKGGVVTEFDVSRLTIKPCLACYNCKKEDNGCIIKDDMQQIYTELIASQVWILASPIYWFSLSAQLKCFIDRLFCLYNQDPKKSQFREKKILAALSYGCEDAFESGCGNAIRSIQDMAMYTGCQLVGYVHGCGDMDANRDPASDGYLTPGTVVTDKALMGKAFSLGASLLE